MYKTIGILLILLLSVIPSILVTPVTATSEQPSSSPPVTENSWAEMTPLPTPRSDLRAATVDGKIYAIGGWDGHNVAVATNEMYNPASNNWTAKAPMPTARAQFGIAAYEGKIYCIGGGTANEVYDPATDTWETKAPIPTARSNVEVSAADGKIYVMGGDPDQTLNYAYDPVYDKWTVKAPVPNIAGGFNSAAIYAASVTVEDKVYWIGVVGFYDEPLGMRILTQVYNPETDSWRLRASPPNSLPDQLPDAAVVTTGKWAPQRIYIFGSNARCAYDPATDKWSLTQRIPMPHSNFGLAVVEDKLYAIGGRYVFTTADLNLEYTPFGYGTVPPDISVVSPQNSNFTGKDTLVFTVNKPVASMQYRLDGQANAILTGNLTLAGLPVGQHNVTVYATDEFGNTGTSDTIYFTIVKETEPFAAVTLAAIATTVAVAAVGILAYFRRSKKSTN